MTNIYDADHAEGRGGGRFRWMLSTCLAAMVGAVAIAIVILGSLDSREASVDVPSVLGRLAKTPLTGAAGLQRQAEGLRWAVPRTDRMQPATGAPNVRQLIHEQIQIRRNGRPYNQIRPYVRIVTRLQPVPARNADVIPAFNPIALYGAQASDRDGGQAGAARTDFRFQVLELLGGTVPADDGQELETQEVGNLVALHEIEEAQARAQGALNEASAGAAASAFSRPLGGAAPLNTTVLHRTRQEGGDEAAIEDLGRQEQRIHVIRPGDRLVNLLRGFGGDHIQVQGMLAQMRQVVPENQVVPGLQLHVTFVPSVTRADKEPARFSLYTEAGEHLVSVMRNAAGEFAASASPFSSTIARAAIADNDSAQASSIYASIYNAALTQGIPSPVILQKLRVHAYDTDFRRRINTGDFAEFLFDLKDEPGHDTSYGDLLYTAMATGGEIYRYWRFRTPDGVVDYYDESGNNSRKFLLRRPVRGENVRLASGFGMRLHPILRYARPHNGIDWAAPTGTPILAAGAGVVEEAKYKGEFGNHIRIRHANGYQSSYSHMSRFAPRIQDGTRVRQGELIGYIGNTGLSAGPHVHFEILVNSRPVDPLSIQVPRERRLTGKPLADYQKERTRVDELMRRQPVAIDNR